MIYDVVVSKNVETKIGNICNYYLEYSDSMSAVKRFINDYQKAINNLTFSAESYQLATDENLRQYGYRKKHFNKHPYFLLYRVSNTTVFIEYIFHESQDYENIFN